MTSRSHYNNGSQIAVERSELDRQSSLGTVWTSNTALTKQQTVANHTEWFRKKEPDDTDNDALPALPTLPQHQHYYRVVYRGVVSLSKDNYVRYGDVLVGTLQFNENSIISVRQLCTDGHAISNPDDLGRISIEHVERLTDPPHILQLRQTYTISSTAPIPLRVAPSVDAPTTQAVLLPGTTVSCDFQIKTATAQFWKLTHRPGWIVLPNETTKKNPILRPFQNSATNTIPNTAATHRRHRPPRRTLLRQEDTTTVASTNVSVSTVDSLSLPSHQHHETTQQEYPKHFYLMRVVAPKGLKVLDAPHLQVHSLIRRPHNKRNHHSTSIFHTLPSRTTPPTILYNHKQQRHMPADCLWEASRDIEVTTHSIPHVAGLIPLSDETGWVMIPSLKKRQYYELLGTALVPQPSPDTAVLWRRITLRSGLPVACGPEIQEDAHTSPTSSRGGGSSEVSSGVGSAFLDSLFRTPNKNHHPSDQSMEGRISHPSNVIPCGMFVKVEASVNDNHDTAPSNGYVRLRGGQGWIPLFQHGKPTTTLCDETAPVSKLGNFWFRVATKRGLKVKLGPSSRAPSIRNDDKKYVRFECGECLRASEIVTFSGESFAKLFRNRHLNLQHSSDDYRTLQSLTTPAEWVQINSESELFLEECTVEPRIERHKQGWRYNVVPDDGIAVHKGPSFDADRTGIILFGGESVAINERVHLPNSNTTWLRMKDGLGWVYDTNQENQTVMVPHSLRHRMHRPKPQSADREAYQTIIKRLFHNENAYSPTKDTR